MRDRRAAEVAGRRGERIAGWWLRLKGWQILDRRVRTPAGEVDLVARRGKLVAFVEVKARATDAAASWSPSSRSRHARPMPVSTWRSTSAAWRE